MYLVHAMHSKIFSTRRIFFPPMAGKNWAAIAYALGKSGQRARGDAPSLRKAEEEARKEKGHPSRRRSLLLRLFIAPTAFHDAMARRGDMAPRCDVALAPMLFDPVGAGRFRLIDRLLEQKRRRKISAPIVRGLHGGGACGQSQCRGGGEQQVSFRLTHNSAPQIVLFGAVQYPLAPGTPTLKPQP